MNWMITFEAEQLNEKELASYHEELDQLIQANERELQEMGL